MFANINEVLFDVEYATLSHRWLEDDAVRLTRHTHEQYLQELPVHSVKATIRDALRIALRLGLQYLWMDSLCIIQDDLDDRRREAASIDRIYGNSYINIVAGSSETEKEGYFFHRDNRWLSAYAVPLQFADTRARAPKQHKVRLGNIWRQEEPGDCVLSERAWVHQERFLPIRALHFLKSQVFWECQQHAATETYPDGDANTTIGLKAINPATKFRLDYASAGLGYAWALEVLQYTQLHMTFQNDKLRALDGIAGQLLQELQDSYVYGLWESTFPQLLAWQRATKAKQERLAKVAPSWSWASLTGPVNFGKLDAIKTDGSFVVAEMIGQFTPVPHLSKAETSGRSALQSERFQHQAHQRLLRIKGRPWEAFLAQTHGTLPALSPLTNRLCFEHQEEFSVITLDVPLDKALEEVLCLPLFVTPGYRGYNIVGLILAQSCSERMTTPSYRRLGVYQRNVRGPDQSEQPRLPFHGHWYSDHDEERELVIC